MTRGAMTRALIHHAPCLDLMAGLPDASVHLIVTDPPYFIDGMGAGWDHQRLAGSRGRAGVVGGMPVGMRFDRQQSYDLQRFMEPVAAEMFRVIKPGGFCVSFSQGRLIHRMAVAMEDAGFEIRDLIGWVRPGQAKAQRQEHHVRKRLASGHVTQEEADRIIESMGGRKTPQLAPELEPMVLGMRPTQGTIVDNWMAHRTGLMDADARLDDRFPSNVMRVPKPVAAERGGGNDHLTGKPVRLISHLIRLFSTEGQTVLDPFLGSGSHAVAAVQEGRNFIGCDVNAAYAGIAVSRLIAAGGIPVRRGESITEVTL